MKIKIMKIIKIKEYLLFGKIVKIKIIRIIRIISCGKIVKIRQHSGSQECATSGGVAICVV